MPGYSLWLLPNPGSKIHTTLQTLITTSLPSHFPTTNPPTFAPHITLTIDLPTEFEDPQAWLDELDLPFANQVQVKFTRLDVEKPFFRKCNIAVEKEGVLGLAVGARALIVDRKEASEWGETEYRPHVSLLYADTDIPDDLKTEIEKTITQAGISLNGEGPLGGWSGGVVWLVPTTRPIGEWKPIAERRLTTDIKKAYATAGS